MFTITEAWLAAHRSDRGGWTKDQCAAIGVSWQLVAGWKRAAIGRQIPEESKVRFEKALRAPQAHTQDLFG